MGRALSSRTKWGHPPTPPKASTGPQTPVQNLVKKISNGRFWKTFVGAARRESPGSEKPILRNIREPSNEGVRHGGDKNSASQDTCFTPFALQAQLGHTENEIQESQRTNR